MASRQASSQDTPTTRDNAAPVYHYNLSISQDTRNYWFRGSGSRSAEVVLVLRRDNGRYLVHTKAFYPQGSYRLMTGGIEAGESPETAALREAYEETGLQVALTRYLARIDYEFNYLGETLAFSSYVFLLQDQGGVLKVHDENEKITDFREVALDALPLVADQLEALQGDSWADWGRFRAPAHRIAYQQLVQDNVSNK